MSVMLGEVKFEMIDHHEQIERQDVSGGSRPSMMPSWMHLLPSPGSWEGWDWWISDRVH